MSYKINGFTLGYNIKLTTMETTFIKSVRTENTGGYVMVDFITLDDGKILAVSSDLIGLYPNMESFDNGDDPISFIER